MKKMNIVKTLGLAVAVAASFAMAAPVSAWTCLDGTQTTNMSTCPEYKNAEYKDQNLSDTFTTVIIVIIGIVGFLAVIMIIIGGITYTTSAGDAGKVKKAKDTIMYGIIGLIVAILAFAIVNFVLANIK